MPDSIKTTRIAFVVAAGLEFATAALFAFIFLSGAAFVGLGTEGRSLLGSALLGTTGVLLALAFTAFGVAGLIIAAGIAKGQTWAKFAGIAMAVLMLAGFPVGTVLGIIALSGLVGRDARDWFEGAAVSRHAPRVPPATV
jgi:hypothetical protein